ncbi:MAG: threonylcarbamoyladenosine tRNA methylthiotransferase [Candidatus Asgardarchaeum californiense]|nr:MAG: threonylcarbamoyladenosine tRNA methylthiotransferase [Candidatus Asgardarchaeum californiense]
MKIYLEVYGCTANKSDANLVKGQLLKNKHEIVEKINDADVLIILTCTVIDSTQHRMLFRIKEFKKTGKKIIVAGCMASIQKEIVREILPNAIFLPPRYSHHIIDVLEEKRIVFEEKNKTVFPKSFDDVFAPISISEGCNFSCSYCITSKARGKLRIFPINEIKQDVCLALKQGCKEIQLTAQDTASYGFGTKTDLGELLAEVCTINEEYKIRVGMMNPFTLLKNIDSVIKGYNNPHIYKFLHLPVQSGDNEILKMMNRKYTTDDFFNIVKQFREHYPNITISTDIIVGFPTETEEQFNNTINLLEQVKPDVTNITRFSARPFTKAKKLKGRVKTEIVKNRSRKLTQLCSKLTEDNNQKHVGKKYNVLITENGKNNTFIGRSENYRPVVFKDKVEIRCFYHAEITDYAPTYLIGSII